MSELPADLVFSSADIGALTRRAVEDGGFKEFVQLAWRYVCPEPLEWNWHLDVFCTELERIAYERKQDISNELAMCVPPASTKSLIVSVLWQPWVWTWWPESRWITCTYEQSLANDLSGESRSLVKSDWYQRAWPTEIKVNRNADRNWANTVGGWRRAVGTGGPITGKHSHFHVGDDLIKEQESRLGAPTQIASVMEKAASFWFGTLVTRATKAGLYARVLVGQRLHVDDVPGIAIRDHGYQLIMLPMRFEALRADSKDRRTIEGELLCEARCDDAGVAKLEYSLGVAGARGQLQQDPQPPGGQLIKSEYLMNRWELLPGKLQAFLDDPVLYGQLDVIAGVYCDAAFKGKPDSDPVCMQLWAKYDGEPWLIDQILGNWTFDEMCQRGVDMMAANPAASYFKVEDAANGPAMVDHMKGKIKGLELQPHGGGCLARQQQVEGVWKSGVVHLPAEAEWMGGSKGFVAEHEFFDGLGTRHDDQVSASGLALVDLMTERKRSWGEMMAAAVP
jgi:predicted phage terminase large subunit-like protein